MKLAIDQDLIDEYYITQNLVGQGDAINHLRAWHSRPRQTPIAILSPYGMGKSSLARKFAADLIEKWKQNKLERIPIFVKLGDFSGHQQIEGLIGCLFTSDINVGGYSFPLFQKLNELSHFSIILDGLDEMRHAMTWDDFKYNFSELSKIILPNTNCLLLGRPNTFQDEIEYQSVIQGKRQIGNSMVSASNAVKFNHFELESFSDDQIDAFFEAFLAHLLKKKGVSRSKIKHRVLEIKSLDMHELFSRPVHAKMMGEIASDLAFALKKFTRYELYQSFLQTTLDRDYARHRGTGITPKQRHIFLERLAWENWIADRDSFRSSQVDINWYDNFDKNIPPEGLLRELLSGSIIETKLGDVFYFSHRTFQEFLVAEFASNNPAIIVKNLQTGFTQETVDFMRENIDKMKILRLFNVVTKEKVYNADWIEILFNLYSDLLQQGLLSLEDQTDPNRWTMSVMKRLQFQPPKKLEDLEFIYEYKTEWNWNSDIFEFYLFQLAGNCGPFLSIPTRDLVARSYTKRAVSSIVNLMDRISPDGRIVLTPSDRLDIIELGPVMTICAETGGIKVYIKDHPRPSFAMRAWRASQQAYDVSSYYGLSIPFSDEKIENTANQAAVDAIREKFESNKSLSRIYFEMGE